MYIAFRGAADSQVVPILIGIVVLNFLMLHLAPGDAAMCSPGSPGGAPPEYVATFARPSGSTSRSTSSCCST